jgi:hypothetical protein
VVFLVVRVKCHEQKTDHTLNLKLMC